MQKEFQNLFVKDSLLYQSKIYESVLHTLICKCKSMRKIYFLFLLFLIPFILFASSKDEIKLIRGVRGEYSILSSSSSLSMKQAVELAREDAKRKALEQAFGVALTIWDQVEISSKGESFNSLAVHQTGGEVIEFKVLEEGNYKSDIRSVETIFYCVANVRVKRMEQMKSDFKAEVNGIKSVYYNNDELLFSVSPNKNCYVNIFLLTDFGEGYLIYPNYMEESVMLEKNKSYNFPMNINSEYTITKDTDAPIEVNRLIFIFTEKEHQFSQQITSRTEIEKWLALLPASERFMYSNAFDIINR